MNLLLVGPSGGGKTESCCTIFGELNFEEDDWNEQHPKKSKLKTKLTRGRNVTIVDTPGLFESDDNKQVLEEIRDCFRVVPDGFTSIVFVVRIGRISQETESSIRLVREIFGEKSVDFITVIFTHEDQLRKGRNKTLTVEDFIRSIPGNEMQRLLKACNNRYVAFDNMQEPNSNACLQQVDKFFDMMEKLQACNNGCVYTNKMMEEAKQQIRQKEEKKEEEAHRKIEERNQKLRREVELELQMERTKYMHSNAAISARIVPRDNNGKDNPWMEFFRKYCKRFFGFAVFLCIVGFCKMWFTRNLEKHPSDSNKL